MDVSLCWNEIPLCNPQKSMHFEIFASNAIIFIIFMWRSSSSRKISARNFQVMQMKIVAENFGWWKTVCCLLADLMVFALLLNGKIRNLRFATKWNLIPSTGRAAASNFALRRSFWTILTYNFILCCKTVHKNPFSAP